MSAQKLSGIGLIVLMVVMLLGLQPHPARAAGVVGNGTPASCSLSALNTALAGGGTVTFNCGSAPVTISVNATISINAQTVIDGGNLITLDGLGATRIIVNNSALTVQNLRIIDGYASGANAAANGGGIDSVYGSTLTVTHCQFYNNISAPNVTTSNAYDYGGGAIFVQGSVLTVTNSTFTNNQVLNGSGGAIHGLRSDLLITNSLFASNQISGPGDGTAGALSADGAQNNGHGQISLTNDVFAHNYSTSEGGAIHIHMYQASDATSIDRSIFADNHVTAGDAQGGGLYFGNGQLTITNSLFVGNSDQGNAPTYDGSGGAISAPEPSVVTIANSTLVGNSALGTSYNANGGAFYIVNNTQPFTLINDTIANNYAGWVGGGITGSPGILKNTIVANNSAYNGGNGWNILQQCSDQLTDGGSNLQYPPKNPNPNYSNEVTCTATVAQVDPKLASLADNGSTMRTVGLLAGSPALNAGSNTTCNAAPINNLDQRGVTRITAGDPTCDMGAYESSAGALTPHADTIGVYRAGNFYLRNQNTTGTADLSIFYHPASTVYPIVGDWTGAGMDTIGVYNQSSGVFDLRVSNTPGIADEMFTLGVPNDQPIAGRWAATATHDGVGIFRPSNGLIYLKNALSTGFADFTMVLGIPGDIGLAADWNGDSVDSPGVYRPSATTFYLTNQVTNGSVFADYYVHLGIAGDLPLAGDWIGQGHAGVGVFRPSNGLIYLKNQLTTGFADTSLVYGIPNDVPVAGRWLLSATTPPLPVAPSEAQMSGQVLPSSVLVPPSVAGTKAPSSLGD